MMGFIGVIAIIVGVAGLFEDFGLGCICIGVGIFFLWGEASTARDNQIRHEHDYGKVAECPFCGSLHVYAMTWDDKRDSVNFWGSASSKFGKRYHCDNCGKEW